MQQCFLKFKHFLYSSITCHTAGVGRLGFPLRDCCPLSLLGSLRNKAHLTAHPPERSGTLQGAWAFSSSPRVVGTSLQGHLPAFSQPSSTWWLLLPRAQDWTLGLHRAMRALTLPTTRSLECHKRPSENFLFL